jgi:hypothetical protein
MAEARTLSYSRPVWQNIKNFFAAYIINGTGGLLFLLLAIFVLWPIISLLLKSISDSKGFTLKYYKEFITHHYYYRSFFNTLILGILTTSVCGPCQGLRRFRYDFHPRVERGIFLFHLRPVPLVGDEGSK